MFAFVAYQLWGTAIQEARAQDALGRDFEQIIHESGLDSTTTTSLVPVSIDTVLPGVPTTPTSSTAPPEPVAQDFPKDIVAGGVVAEIRIPAIDVKKYVVAGVSVKDLRKGVGHFPNTPFPGQLGNASIAGHRTTYGQPFYRLDKLRKGDDIQVSTILGGTYVYVVTGSEEVGKNDYRVISDSDPNVPTLTLVTCTPIGTASRRLIVHATLDPTRSSVVGRAELYYGQEASSIVTTPAPGDGEPDVEPGEVEADTVVPGTFVPGTAAGVGIDTQSTSVAQSNGFDASGDAFNQGWFADGKAWPQLIGWFVLLLLVVGGSWQLAKRNRRLWLGILVGFAPFVVVLYFFFENLNRMLPAAI